MQTTSPGLHQAKSSLSSSLVPQRTVGTYINYCMYTNTVRDDILHNIIGQSNQKLCKNNTGNENYHTIYIMTNTPYMVTSHLLWFT